MPAAIKGLFFGPALVCLLFILKTFCPGSAGDACFSDQFSVVIFMPLIAVYDIFGGTDVIKGQEFLLIIAYWAVIGFLIGLILDLYTRQSQYSPEQYPPL